MTEEIGDGRISNFKGLVTLTLDRVILHTIVHHSSSSTYMPNFIEIKQTFCGQTDGCTHIHTHVTYIHTDGQTFETGFIRLTLSMSQPKKTVQNSTLPLATHDENHVFELIHINVFVNAFKLNRLNGPNKFIPVPSCTTNTNTSMLVSNSAIFCTQQIQQDRPGPLVVIGTGHSQATFTASKHSEKSNSTTWSTVVTNKTLLTLFLASTVQPAYRRTRAHWLWPFCAAECSAVQPAYTAVTHSHPLLLHNVKNKILLIS